MGAIVTEPPAVRTDRARLAPWALWVLTLVISAAALVLFAPTAAVGSDLPDYVSHALGVLWGASAGLIGALITSRRRNNRIGWLMVGMGLLVSFMVFASRASQTDHPAADAMNILADTGWVLWVAVFSLFILLFPDGRPVSRRWRPVVWFAALWPPSFLLVGLLVAPEDLLLDSPSSVSRILTGILLVLTLVAVGISAVLRFRRSVGTERQQLKWFAYGTSLGLALALAGLLLPAWGGLVSSLGLYGPVAGAAVALFRYRLYEIDELISQTFVYGALVAILAGVYTASIRLFNAVFVGVTGLGSEEVLVITTLILATTFTPIKKRLEAIVEARYKTPEGDTPQGPTPEPAGPGDIEGRLRAIVREELERAGHAR